jgi:hypothetical protein
VKKVEQIDAKREPKGSVVWYGVKLFFGGLVVMPFLVGLVSFLLFVAMYEL